MMPLRCGRMDRHDAHHWPGPVTKRTYLCGGEVVVEGAWRDWDALDDRREDELDRQIRDGLAGWGESA